MVDADLMPVALDICRRIQHEVEKRGGGESEELACLAYVGYLMIGSMFQDVGYEDVIATLHKHMLDLLVEHRAGHSN